MRAGLPVRSGRPRGVGLEVALGEGGERSVGAQFLQRPVEVGQQPAVLAGRESLFALLSGLPGDFDRGVVSLGQIRVDGDAVVDDGVDPALAEQLDRLREALDGLDLGPGITGDLCPVCWSSTGLWSCP